MAHMVESISSSDRLSREQEMEDVPRPRPPVISSAGDFLSDMQRIQSFINAFRYNYTSCPFVKPKKTGGARHMLETYQQLLDFSLPIQCVEAVFIASILTAPYSEVVRIPLSFESKCGGQVYKHIVLAVRESVGLKWGALGISRRSNLMDKPWSFESLWDLLENYAESYADVGHTLQVAYPGLPLPHNFHIDSAITWKALKLRMGNKHASISRQELTSFLNRVTFPPEGEFSSSSSSSKHSSTLGTVSRQRKAVLSAPSALHPHRDLLLQQSNHALSSAIPATAIISPQEESGHRQGEDLKSNGVPRHTGGRTRSQSIHSAQNLISTKATALRLPPLGSNTSTNNINNSVALRTQPIKGGSSAAVIPRGSKKVAAVAAIAEDSRRIRDYFAENHDY